MWARKGCEGKVEDASRARASSEGGSCAFTEAAGAAFVCVEASRAVLAGVAASGGAQESTRGLVGGEDGGCEPSSERALGSSMMLYVGLLRDAAAGPSRPNPANGIKREINPGTPFGSARTDSTTTRVSVELGDPAGQLWQAPALSLSGCQAIEIGMPITVNNTLRMTFLYVEAGEGRLSLDATMLCYPRSGRQRRPITTTSKCSRDV